MLHYRDTEGARDALRERRRGVYSLNTNGWHRHTREGPALQNVAKCLPVNRAEKIIDGFDWDQRFTED